MKLWQRGLALVFCCAIAAHGRADVTRWDTGDPIPGAVGITVGPAANFTGVNLQFAEFSFADLTGAKFNKAQLANGRFWFAKLAGADFSDAIVNHASFSSSTGFSKEQLYATASYKAKELPGINLEGSDITGWNFRRQNLASASLNSAKVVNVDFTGANLTGVDLYAATIAKCDFTDANVSNIVFSFGKLTDTNFTRADLRDSIAFDPEGTVTTNAILPNGHIHGLTLASGEKLRVANHRGRSVVPGVEAPGTPIVIDDHATMSPGSALDVVFDSTPWHSTISFAPGISAQLDGMLELRFANEVDVAAQIGRKFKVFNWGSTLATGHLNVASPHLWDASKLLSSGEVTLLAVVPEPSSSAILAVGSATWFALRESRRRRRVIH